VDVSHLGLDAVGITEGGITLGAAASLETVLASPIGGTPAGALICEACRTTAHSGIRAVASVGGAVLSGEPSDLLLALRALDAVCVLRGTGIREVPLIELPPGHGELLLEVRVPPAPRGFGVALERVARTPRDRSIVAAAAALVVERDTCVRATLALLGVAPKVITWRSGETLLEGKVLTADRIGRAAATLEAEATAFADHLGDAEYRRAVGTVLARRALMAAWQRSGAKKS
jgi:CO/xanthine dehydrogenase FAD-binding subunit